MVMSENEALKWSKEVYRLRDALKDVRAELEAVKSAHDEALALVRRLLPLVTWTMKHHGAACDAHVLLKKLDAKGTP